MMAYRDCRIAMLDWARIGAVMLVVANHTSPLIGISETADFWLTRILARLAVPFFLMITGYFLAGCTTTRLLGQIKKLIMLYGISVMLYLPLNFYAEHFEGVGDFLQKLFIDGTFYHLWYFPATVLGLLVAHWLRQCFGMPVALLVSMLLYVIGLGGDSYYGLVAQNDILSGIYGGIFALTDYTRNGLFMTPLFLLLGAWGITMKRFTAFLGFVLSLGIMSLEGFWLHGLGVQRHDSMYVMLPICMVFLFALLMSFNSGTAKNIRTLSMGMYILHPLCIVVVRGIAGAIGMEALLIDNHLVHYLTVLFLTAVLVGAGIVSAKTIERMSRKNRFV